MRLGKIISFAGILLAIIVPLLSNHNKNLPSATMGIPVEFKEESQNVYDSIDQIVDDGTYLYILFDKYEGLVGIYDANGNYYKTIALYTHKNGIFRIAVDTGTFYIQDKQHNMYAYCNGEFVSFLPYDENAHIRKGVDFEASSENYKIRMESVWRITDSEEICVINRPQAAFFSQGNLYTLIGIGFLLLVAILSLDWQNSLKKH